MTPLERLPTRLPLFPLQDSLLLPGTALPIYVLESRYEEMINDSLEKDGFVGVVQPVGRKDGGEPNGLESLQPVGCAGIIGQNIARTDIGAIVQLFGVCRFRLLEVFAPAEGKGYRESDVGFQEFYEQDTMPRRLDDVNREDIVATFVEYSKHNNLIIDVDVLKKINGSVLVDALCMACPFDGKANQALLEAKRGEERARLLKGLMEMSMYGTVDEGLN